MSDLEPKKPSERVIEIFKQIPFDSSRSNADRMVAAILKHLDEEWENNRPGAGI